MIQRGFFIFTLRADHSRTHPTTNNNFQPIMMARKTIEFFIKIFILILVATAGLWVYNVLELIGIVA